MTLFILLVPIQLIDWCDMIVLQYVEEIKSFSPRIEKAFFECQVSTAVDVSVLYVPGCEGK